MGLFPVDYIIGKTTIWFRIALGNGLNIDLDVQNLEFKSAVNRDLDPYSYKHLEILYH